MGARVVGVQVRKLVEVRQLFHAVGSSTTDMGNLVVETATAIRRAVEAGAYVETIQARLEYNPTWLRDEIVVTGEDKS